MPRVTIGTEPVQVARYNTKRRVLAVQFIPSSIIVGNTGLIFGKFGSAPKADTASNTWDFLLNPGAADGSNIGETALEAPMKEDLWLISDTAGQIVNVDERNIQEAPAITPPTP